MLLEQIAERLEPKVLAPRCLVVDDDAQVRRSIARVTQLLGLTPVEAASGDEALEILAQDGEVPIIISDVNMPGISGIAFLEEVVKRFPDTGVLMLSGVADVKVAVQCLDKGALDYIAKPALIEEVRARLAKALEKRELILQKRFYQRNLELRVRVQANRIKELFLQGVQTLAQALEAKDAYTSGHSIRVSRYAVQTAIRLGFTGERLEEIRLGAEFQHITEHTVLGERILAPLARENPTVLRIVRSHHERMDGRGFPDKMPGDQIPIEARIVCVVDSFDAMTTNRAYRASRTPTMAMEELDRCLGSQFDPEVVRAFKLAFPDPLVLPLMV
jgi:putative two-component system response regulator